MKGTKLLVISVFSTAFLSFTPVDKKLIIVDAGHGGNDMGANRYGIYEKDIVLNIGKEIQKFNNSQDQYEVILTRDNDTYSQLSDRTTLINKLNPEMVISLHVNSSPKSESTEQGAELYTQNTEGSKKLADRISKKFNTLKIEEKNLHILRESKAPTVLMELGYINNTKDREYLTSEKGQKEIAQKFSEIFREY
ncbi:MULTISPECIES: N-acetylmuramoyl-L-alanine amidase [Chryseobacterium]|uniref:N-acetylmuramoyl-L-alanine amidase family protein n=1 Tax=Chryseobacterium TaxID=59732 RepID=UPI000D383550|nr:MULTISPECIES: N-acetylmuramoyl-L-alanine amidase [Chryseobacterium]PTT72245.1 N-acetylmuramoyl-L-alanine amidase [Chryseobacterium sp. HMWF001]PVV57873.1 N-acetylmuramoyl-L-alanine amidase [Chryseobacterium sp. HMWF035]WBX98689.1 N-acetylmuramoyl-L-alanine amidase [Chryseobacterium gambrini]